MAFPECNEWDDDEPSPMRRLQTAVLFYCGKSQPPKALSSFTFNNLWPYPLSQTVKNGGLRRFLSTICSFTLVVSKQDLEAAYCTAAFMDFFGGEFNVLLDCLPKKLATLSIETPFLQDSTVIGLERPRFPSLTSLRLENILFFVPYSLTGEIVLPADFGTFEGFILRHHSLEHLALVDCSMDIPESGFDTNRTWASFINTGLKEHLPNLKELRIINSGLALGIDAQVVRRSGYARLNLGYGWIDAAHSRELREQEQHVLRPLDIAAHEEIQSILSHRRTL